jgi:SAM-dependent methyltransferase
MGSGPGTLLPYERRAVGPEGTIISFDISFQMMRQAMAKDSGGAMCRMQATAMFLPLKDATCDALVCFAAFPHFADKSAAMAEMSRVAKPGASLHIAHLLSREELCRHHGEKTVVSRDVLPEDEAMRGIFREVGFSEPSIIDCPGFYLASALKLRGISACAARLGVCGDGAGRDVLSIKKAEMVPDQQRNRSVLSPG